MTNDYKKKNKTLLSEIKNLKFQNNLMNTGYFQLKKISEDLKESEQRFKNIFDYSNVGVSLLSPNGRWLEVNDALCKIVGYSRKKLLSSNFKDITYPDDIPISIEFTKKLLSGKVSHVRFEKRYINKNKNIVWVNLSIVLVYSSVGKPLYFVVHTEDITERKTYELKVERIDRTLKMISGINQSLIRVNNESDLLNEACRITVEIGGYSLAWVGLLENDKDKTIRPVAQFGLDSGYVKKAKLSWSNTARGRGPGGVAARTGIIKIIKDISKDASMAPWKKEALKRGFRSAIALPLKNKNDVFGMILIYSNNINIFSDDEVKILNELIGDLSFGIINYRKEQQIYKLNEAVQTSGEVVYMTNKEGVITFANTEFYNLYGYSESEIIGKVTPRILKSGQRGKKEYSKLWKDLISGKIVKDEHSNKTKNGKLLIVDSSINPIFDKTGIIGFLAIQRDISEKKRTEDKLKKDEELVRNVNSIMLRWKPDGKIDFINNYGSKIFGYDKDELIGKNVNILVPKTESSGKDLSFLIEDIAKHTHKYLFNENENIRKNGTKFWVAWTNRAIEDKKGNLLEVLAVGNDITEVKKIESKLSESEEKYRRLFESAKDSILILNAETGEITDSNPFIQNLLDYTSKELIGSKIYEISPFKDIIENKEKFLELQQKGYVFYDNLPLKTKSGKLKQVEFVSNAYLVAGKKVIQCNIRDITERIKKEKELDQAKGDFLSLTSHQLRTPLSATKWVLEALMHDKNYTPKQMERFNYLVISNERLINLVNKLLDVTRIESGKLVVNKEIIDLKKLVDDLSLSFTVLSDNNNKKIKIIAPVKLKNVFCDPLLIHEALENILSNAINYSPEEAKEIDVSITERTDDYLISIHNDGVIDDTSIERMKNFDKFSRGVKASESKPSGSGLGLYITKKVIEAGGGKVWFESNIKDGTTFYLTIIKSRLNK